MNDDDKQQSYERLDETNPERNHRSFFDWLRGKEETDEEKLRRKLDEELKEAARKRAKEFEEEQRVEEQREVAETRKLKKRWRAKLVEKSKKLLEEAAEHGDEPTNGYEIAKLMVAERIVKLHDILTTEDLRKSEMKSLKIHIDFMGLLSEKLDRPELEVPEEVEELYQTIAASVEETTGETPPETPDQEPEIPPLSEADAAYNAFATSIVRAIRRSLRSQERVSSGGSRTDTGSPSSTATGPDNSATRGPEEHHSKLTERLLTIVKNAALSGDAIKQEISHADHARKLADVAEKASIADRFITHGATPEAHPSTERGPVDKIDETRPGKGFNLPPNRKIKHLSDIELIALAETVHVPGGRLLSDVYRKGELDREGLVKVLESYDKGLDYRSELALRRDKWQSHKEASPEYLTQPAPAQSAVPLAQQVAKPDDAISEYRPTISPSRRIRALVSPSALKGTLRNIGLNRNKPSTANDEVSSETSRLVRDSKSRDKRQSQVVLLVASMLLAIIIIVAVIELTSL